MITWMQKHKKYLVVTIWVSTIAFVGAGFVGWGAYDMNTNRAKSVAKVGNRNISISQFQQKYSTMYEFYLNASNGKFTQEQAEQMGLDKVVLKRLIQDNVMLNYADELGLDVSQEEIILALMVDPSFMSDGKFDKAKYESVLKQARISPKDYEQNLASNLLLDKLFNALKIDTNSKDLDMLAASYFMKDRVSTQIINLNRSDIKVDESELKSIWESNKDKYLTQTKYNLKGKFIPKIISDENLTALQEYYDENKAQYRDGFDKILSFEVAKERVKDDYDMRQTRKLALSQYLKAKKGELEFEFDLIALEDDYEFDAQELKNLQIGDYIKPVKYRMNYQDGYLISKLESKDIPKPMSYEEAREFIIGEYIDNKLKNNLENMAKGALENFNGRDIGFIARDSKVEIAELNESEVSEFINLIFDSKSKDGYVILGNKAVVYKITDQKLASASDVSNYENLLRNSAISIKNEQLIEDLLSSLQHRYKIEQYYKGQ
ncbi:MULTISPECIES: peptidylprolyl isomerase [Campylobacter]|uniref:peptidylprolyl isomerase n=1 Tax=Campylobacter TaxID=194 RepID=UPI000A336BED|nr:peptidylprolyl isomerase [Campylobacter sp. P0124]MCR8696491.1 peptidylprolyl isomerase [Campylobacter sp. RM19073]MEE3703975.1 peptidylprolyl isomerase [Campylobacter sp. CX2-8023-23]MEE3775878.1 peptidylprolyl isomerase [Campylobacter sp. CX2-4080-23]